MQNITPHKVKTNGIRETRRKTETQFLKNEKKKVFFCWMNVVKRKKQFWCYLLNAREVKVKAIVDPTKNLIPADKVRTIHHANTGRHWRTRTMNKRTRTPTTKENKQVFELEKKEKTIMGWRFWGEIWGSLKESFDFYFGKKRETEREIEWTVKMDWLIDFDREETETETETETESERGEERTPTL